MADLKDLYKEVILDHNRTPRNFKELKTYSHRADGHNALCGDKYTIYLDIRDDIIQDISFEGSGCAISKSSASLMTTLMKGTSVQDASGLFQTFHRMMTAEKSLDDLSGKICKMRVLEGVKAFPTRIKCATLIWHTMMRAIEKNEKKAEA